MCRNQPCKMTHWLHGSQSHGCSPCSSPGSPVLQHYLAAASRHRRTTPSACPVASGQRAWSMVQAAVNAFAKSAWLLRELPAPPLLLPPPLAASWAGAWSPCVPRVSASIAPQHRPAGIHLWSGFGGSSLRQPPCWPSRRTRPLLESATRQPAKAGCTSATHLPDVVRRCSGTAQRRRRARMVPQRVRCHRMTVPSAVSMCSRPVPAPAQPCGSATSGGSSKARPTTREGVQSAKSLHQTICPVLQLCTHACRHAQAEGPAGRG